MSPKLLFFSGLLLVILCHGVLGEESKKVEGTPKLAQEIIPAGSANLGELRSSIQALLSPLGKVIILPVERKVFIQDTPENLPVVMSLAREMTKPVPNIRVEITLAQIGQTAARDLSLRGSGTFRVPAIHKNELSITGRGQNASDSSDSLAGQELLVSSGGYASLEVLRSVILPSYFQNWVLNNRLIAIPEGFHWTEVGTRLVIHPTIQGEEINIEVTPQLVSVNNDLTIDIKELSTRLTVANGVPLQIGGFSRMDFNGRSGSEGPSPLENTLQTSTGTNSTLNSTSGAVAEFNANFFGYGTTRSSNGGSFTLKATIEPLQTVEAAP